MQVHDLRAPCGSRKKKRILGRGRGSGRGKTSGRGQGRKQNARAGRGIINSLEGGQMPLIRRLPKVGFRSKRPILYQVIKVGDLSRFKSGTVVDPFLLKDKGRIKNIYRPYKILGVGEIKNALTVKAYGFSKSAQEKIVNAGGQAEVIDQSMIKEAEMASKK